MTWIGTITGTTNAETGFQQNNGSYLFPNDPLFGEQRGLFNQKNTLATIGASPGGANILAYGTDKPVLRIEQLPPHILDMLRMIPYFRENMEQLSEEELWDEITRIVKERPEDVPPHIADELMHELFFHEMFSEMKGWAGDEIVEDNLMGSGAGQSYRIDASVLPAWEISRGEGVTVAVIDTGIDIDHEDLAENVWTNTLEIPGNGIDDDGNGYIDDVNGWNFYDGNGIVFDADNPSEESHGTHIAGIIAAKEDNGKGIAGIATRARIMPVKVFENGMAYTSDIIEDIRYAEAMGASIVNCSWGTTTYNQALQDAMENRACFLYVLQGTAEATMMQTRFILHHLNWKILLAQRR